MGDFLLVAADLPLTFAGADAVLETIVRNLPERV